MKKLLKFFLVFSMVLILTVPTVAAPKEQKGVLKTIQREGYVEYFWEANEKQLEKMNKLKGKGLTEREVFKRVAPDVYDKISEKFSSFDEPFDQTDDMIEVAPLWFDYGYQTEIELKLYGKGLQSYVSLETQAYTTELELLHEVVDDNTGDTVKKWWKGVSAEEPTIDFIDHTMYCEPDDGTYHTWVQYRAFNVGTGHWQTENRLSRSVSYDNPYK